MPTIATWGDLLAYRNGDLATYGDPLANVRVGEAVTRKTVVWDGPTVRADWEAARPPYLGLPFFRDPFGRDVPLKSGWTQRDVLSPQWSHPFFSEFFGVNSTAITRTISDPMSGRVTSGWWGQVQGTGLTWLQQSGVTGFLSPTNGPLNPTFDAGLQNWTASGGATISLALDFAHTGNYSIKITPDGVGTPTVTSEEFQVVAGTVYGLEGWGMLGTGPAGPASRNLVVEWRNSSHVLISTNTITVSLTTVGTWQPFNTLNVTAPVGAAFAVIRFTGAAAVTQVWHMDEVLLYPRAGDMSTDGTFAHIVCSAISELDTMMLPINMANVDIYIDTGLTSIVTPTGGPLYTYFDFRTRDGKNTYQLRLTYNTNGKTAFDVLQLANSFGPPTPISGTVQSGFNTFDDLTIHIQCIGRAIRVRWYLWDTPEPTAWNIVVPDITVVGTGYYTGTGQFRISCLRDPTNTNANPSFTFRKFVATETQPAGAYCNSASPGNIVAAQLNCTPVADFDFRYKVCTDSFSHGSAAGSLPLARIVDYNNYVRARLDFNTDQVLGWGIEQVVGGVFSGSLSSGLVRDNSDEGVHEVNVFYWVRFRGEGTTLMIKIWRDGNPEPTTWNGTAQTTWTTAGVIGVHNRVASSAQPLPMRHTVQAFTIDGYDPLDTGVLNVQMSLDDGLPSEVTNASGLALTSLDSDLLAPVDWPKTPAAYWSQFRTDSPVAQYPRDVAPVTADVNLVASDGVRPTRIFTGQMTDMPADGRTAKVTAVSGTLRKLQKLVQPPPVWGDARGLTGTWVVSWALAQCGVYVSPPPRSGCIYWAPMHGSLHPFIHKPEPNDEFHEMIRKVSFITPTTNVRPTFIPGPFVTGVYAHVDSQLRLSTNDQFLGLAYGEDLFSKAGNTGRFEFWCRTDTDVDLTNIPGGNGSVPWLVGFDAVMDASHRLSMGLGKDYRPFLTINDGFNNQTYFGANAIPQDGQWHFVGIAYTFSSSTVWFKVDQQPMQTITPSPAFFITSMPDHDDFGSNGPQITAYIPAAEFQVTSGGGARPDGVSGGDVRWINDPAYFEASDAGAIIRPSANVNPEALVEMAPRRAIELISEWAQAELAMTGFDAQDRFLYLPMPYWVETAQQSLNEVITTDDNLADLNVRYDVTRVRNSVAVQYNQTRVENNAYGTLMGTQLTGPLPGGTTSYTFTMDKPAVYVSQTVQLLQPADFTALPVIASWATLCDAADGTGNYADSTQVDARITFYNAGQVTFQFTTLDGRQWYFVNSGSVSTIAAQGIPVTVVQATELAQNPISIARRGELGLPATLPAVQDAAWARFIASELVARLANPRWRAEGVRVFGDPRRRPGTLVKLQDPDGSALDGYGRVMTVQHDMAGARYEQTLTIVQASLVAVWDQSAWDDGSVWGL